LEELSLNRLRSTRACLDFKVNNMIKELGLSKEQKTKLIEMSKVLFPAYQVDFDNDYAMGMLSIATKEKNDWRYIHWYEFCIEHIVSELQSAIPTRDKVFREMPPYVSNVYAGPEGRVWSFFTEFFFNLPKMNGHPVDYLWDEFKKHF
jgi:hypothetical protein